MGACLSHSVQGACLSHSVQGLCLSHSVQENFITYMPQLSEVAEWSSAWNSVLESLHGSLLPALISLLTAKSIYGVGYASPVLLL